MRRLLIVVEKAGSNFSAYSPDLPGCVATGATPEDVIEVRS
jgi:predicted RNase H-like HicB family nuclease